MSDRSDDWWEVWQMNDDLPAGNADYLGSVRAQGEIDAEKIGRERFGISADQRVEVFFDEERSLRGGTAKPEGTK